MSKFNINDAIQAYNELSPTEFNDYLSRLSDNNIKAVHHALEDTYYNELIFSIAGAYYNKSNLQDFYSVIHQRLERNHGSVDKKHLLLLLESTGGPKKPTELQLKKIVAVDHLRENIVRFKRKNLDMKECILTWLEYIDPSNNFEADLKKNYLKAEEIDNYDNVYKLMNGAINDYDKIYKLIKDCQLYDDIVDLLKCNGTVDNKKILYILDAIGLPKIPDDPNILGKMAAITNFQIYRAFSGVDTDDEKEAFFKWLDVIKRRGQGFDPPTKFEYDLIMNPNPENAYNNMNKAMNKYGDKKINK